MSHFIVHVLVPRLDHPTEEEIHAQVSRALDPFSEEKSDDGKWDWWCVGGRWSGSLAGLDPQKDPDNFERCFLCGGTGTRPGGREQFGEEWVRGCGGCNGCHGRGRSLKFPSHFKNVGNVVPLSELMPRFEEKLCPFAVLTPAGEWIERGKMGWWAMVSGEKNRAEWTEEVRTVYGRFPESVAVLVDCHV